MNSKECPKSHSFSKSELYMNIFALQWIIENGSAQMEFGCWRAWWPGAGLDRISGSIWIRGMRFSFSGWPREKWNLHSADEKIRSKFLKHTLAPDWVCCDGNSCPACPRLYGVVIGQSCTFQGTQKYSQGGWVAARRSRPDAAQHRHQRGQMPPASSRTSMRVVYRAVPLPLLPPHTVVVPPLVTVSCRDIGAKLL